MSAEESSHEQLMRSAQLEELRLRNEKLGMELRELRKAKPWYQVPILFVPLATALVTIAGFGWGLIRYQADYKAQSAREQEAREREFMKPWLESQRTIYLEALSAAGIVGNTEDEKTRKKAAEEFWSLYQGEMILVETTAVSGAMVAFGNCLKGSQIVCAKPDLDSRARALGTAMHESMAATAGMTYKDFSASQFKYR